MIVSHHELELILNPRIRQRTFQLPVRRGEWGELKRCPARKGGVYTLRANPEYERYRLEAQDQPSQRAAVLWVIECCERHLLPPVVVTVRDVPELVDGSWLVRFSKGDQAGSLDRPRLLAARPSARSGDYTSVAALALPGASEEVPAAEQARFAVDGELRHADFLSEARKRALEAIEEVSAYSTTRSDRRRLRAAAFQIRMMDKREDAA